MRFSACLAACLVVTVLLTSCGKGSAEAGVVQVSNPDLAFLLTHLEIVAESPFPHLPPKTMEGGYRIMGVSEQGACADHCPRSTVYVAIWTERDHRDDDIRLYRFDQFRAWEFLGIEDYRNAVEGEYFLSFRVRSRSTPRTSQDFLVRVGFDRAEALAL